MRRFPAVIPCLLPMLLLAVLAGCGGGSTSTTVGIPATISLTPATVSINLGSAQLGNTAQLTAAVLDSDGLAVASNLVPQIAYLSSNPAVAGVSPNGLVCGGAWDANFIVCNPGPAGTAVITARGAGLTSNTVAVYVHQRVDTITINPTAVNCKSQGQTQQMTAHAFSNGADVTSTVGPFNWSAQSPEVATVNSNINGLLTANTPGATTVVAFLTGSSTTVSTPGTFITCPVKSLQMHLPDLPDTSITLDAGSSHDVTINAVDTLGQPLKGLTLSVVSSAVLVGAGAFPPANTTTTGTLAASTAGTVSLVPVCAPPSCNINLNTQYGNVFTLKVNGTSLPTVYAAGSNSTSLIPISTATTPLAAGTAITLTSKPNSIQFARSGSELFLGSDSNGAMHLSTGNTSVASATGLLGNVLTVSPDGNQVVVSDLAADRVFVADITATTVPLAIPGATAAAFTPDGSKLFIVSGSTLFVYQPNTTLQTTALGGSANDIAMLTPGWFTYVAQPGAIRAYATCNTSAAGSVATNNPKMIASLPNGTALVAADSPNIDLIHVNSTGAGCPATVTHALTTAAVGQAFTPRQIIPLADSSKVFITTDIGLLVYDVAANTVSRIALAGGALPFTGGASLDSATLYIGASDNAVHVINVATGADTQQIAVPFTPDLVAVSPQ